MSDSDDRASTCASVDEQNDEQKGLLEIKQFSRRETLQIQTICGALTVLLVVTAACVTITSYFVLDNDDEDNFKLAFQQFARTVGDAAVEQTKDLGRSIDTLAHAVSIQAEVMNATWPFFVPYMFELMAQDFKKTSYAEIVSLNNKVVQEDRDAYLDFVDQSHQEWVKNANQLAYGDLEKLDTDPSKYNGFISKLSDDGMTLVPDDLDREVYYPESVLSPPPFAYGPTINWNLASEDDSMAIIDAITRLEGEGLVDKIRPLNQIKKDHILAVHPGYNVDGPHGYIFHPVNERANDGKSEIVAIIHVIYSVDASLQGLLPDNVKGIYVVIENSCGQFFSYRIDGPNAIYQGEGDFHDTRYDNMAVHFDLLPATNPLVAAEPGHCTYVMHVYPTISFEEEHDSETPKVFAIVVAAAFALVLGLFLFYDTLVRKRNHLLLLRAARSHAIVASLFPTGIRDRLFLTAKNPVAGNSLKTYLKKSESGDVDDALDDSKPIADLYVETTVMFADIVGFTAWSSQREPAQVFTLLETVYNKFDHLARRRQVFKVETVGDCYVAVSGVPEPRADHAVAMARFAHDCLTNMDDLTKKLEVKLGPETCDLCLRIGIHSGAVTAGVLRGERSRFQLFGDTMNTTARMESTSKSGCIQVSQETATLLIAAGKESWLHEREDRVYAKGKGELQTYWLSPGTPAESKSKQGGMERPSHSDHKGSSEHSVFMTATSQSDERSNRMVKWNVEVLLRLLKMIVARRGGRSRAEASKHMNANVGTKDSLPLEEVKEIITLPEFNRRNALLQEQADAIEIPPNVLKQLESFVACIANMYRGNHFHNFDHASHVVMSMSKFMARIVAPTELDVGDEREGEESDMRSERRRSALQKGAAGLHDYTYGITSDPLTQFACVFSALIHDVDHTGVPNTQLIKENPELGNYYKCRSVAEQNSFDLSWRVLMDERFDDLRNTLCNSEAELSRFRQLVINSVMATDLGDKELKALRNARWDKAFFKDTASNGTAPVPSSVALNKRDEINRKATIVIEHLIQASDVSHTMQHWHVYRKWNERLFMEMFDAYKKGRADTNPAEFWYKGEIGFFDFYVIPLAKKLKECGVFGVSSDETLNYALQNRKEWEIRGQEVVASLIERHVKGEKEDE